MGPLIFLVFISDLGDNIEEEEATTLKFVDDTKLLKGVKEEEDVENFQSVIDKIYDWQVLNNMASTVANSDS